MLPTIDVLLIGHVCRDETLTGPQLGGTVVFSGLTARSLGLRPGIVTSAPDDMAGLMAPLEGIPIQRIDSAQATTFVNRYTPEGRQQTLLGRAAILTWTAVPDAWLTSSIVHIAPVADEISPDIITRLPGAFIGLTPQGWMRTWDKDGLVRFKGWDLPEHVLRSVSAAVFSIEDVQGDEYLARSMALQCPVMVVTRGAEGCTLFVEGRPKTIMATPAEEIDPTGAGDIFAMAFFARLKATGDPVIAARFASVLAGRSVTRIGMAGIPTETDAKEALRLA
jgi:sugar/nucleoside kinase (ribokinase family)